MKARDLMIGDWVDIKATNSFIYKRRKITANDLIDSIHRECVYIPLTAEILEKNGFTLKKADMYFPNDGYIWFDSIENNELVEIYIYDKPINGVRVLTKITNDCKAHGGVNKVHSCEIENVHELQHALRLCGIDKEIVL